MLRVRFMQEDFGCGLKIAIMQDDGKTRMVAKPLEFVDRTLGAILEPTLEFRFDGYDKQELAAFFLDWIEIAKKLNINLDQGWSREKTAMAKHLEDMRSLVFKGKQVKKDA